MQSQEEEEEQQKEQKEQDSNWAHLIRLNPTIRDINFVIREDLETATSEFWEAVGTSLHNPRRLKVGGDCFHVYQDSAQYMFWRACSRFEEFEYVGFNQWESQVATRLDFTRLKRLSYSTMTLDGNPDRDMDFFSHCRGLTKLSWTNDSSQFPIGEFLEYLKQSTWPLLNDLSLDSIIHSHEDFATVIHQLPPLQRFRLNAPNYGPHSFGPQCFGYLGHYHFETLRYLNMDGCRSFSSRMALVTLVNCHLLEEFSTQRICVFELANCRPWVCHGLKRLAVHFDGNLGRSGIPVFNQLSRLTCLEELDMSVLESHEAYEIGIQKGPQWRLDQGLERLSTLTLLRKLTLNKKGQDLVLEDLEWMFNHWPLLETLAGNFSSDPSTQELLVAMVEKRGISREYSSFYGLLL